MLKWTPNAGRLADSVRSSEDASKWLPQIDAQVEQSRGILDFIRGPNYVRGTYADPEQAAAEAQTRLDLNLRLRDDAKDGHWDFLDAPPADLGRDPAGAHYADVAPPPPSSQEYLPLEGDKSSSSGWGAGVGWDGLTEKKQLDLGDWVKVPFEPIIWPGSADTGSAVGHEFIGGVDYAARHTIVTGVEAASGSAGIVSGITRWLVNAATPGAGDAPDRAVREWSAEQVEKTKRDPYGLATFRDWLQPWRKWE
ncbi:MAG: hypothetical protein QOG31_1404 [Thermoplasmata archaeon]|nr:hypothetical protein [Thermoplasmata archaeon]